MNTKLCTKCNTTKSTTEFYKQTSQKDGFQRYCKSCKSEMQKEYKEANLEIIKIKTKEYKLKHREEILIKQKEYRDNNRDLARAYYEKNKEDILRKAKEYRMENIEAIKESQKRWREENKEKKALNGKAWREKNKVRLKIKSKQYRLKNEEKLKEVSKRYYQANREVIIKKTKENLEKNRDRYLARKRAYNKTDFAKLSHRNTKMKRRTAFNSGDVTTAQINSLLNDAKNCYWCSTSLKGLTAHIDHYIPISKGGQHTLSNLVVSCPHCNHSKSAKDPIEFANSLGRLL